jgi:hypothetical protein
MASFKMQGRVEFQACVTCTVIDFLSIVHCPVSCLETLLVGSPRRQVPVTTGYMGAWTGPHEQWDLKEPEALQIHSSVNTC